MGGVPAILALERRIKKTRANIKKEKDPSKY